MEIFIRVSFIAIAILLLTSGSGAEEQKKTPAKDVVAANTAFSLDLYHQLASENDGNMFFSPYSITTALVMAADGARGETSLEMGNVLRLPRSAHQIDENDQLNPWNLSLIHNSMAAINKKLSGKSRQETETIRSKVTKMRARYKVLSSQLEKVRRSEKIKEYQTLQNERNKVRTKLEELLGQLDQYEIHIANALWAEKSYPLKQSYLDTINKYYKTGGLFPVDFKHNYEAERQQINNWIKDQTKKRIANLIPKYAVDDATPLNLTNAIYFKGEWATPFDETDTREKEFFLNNGSTINASLMFCRSGDSTRYAAFNADGSFFKTPRMIRVDQKKQLYPDKDGFAIVELPYKGEKLAMVVIAPNRYDGLPNIERKLTSQNIDYWLKKSEKRKVNVYLPKFKLDTYYQIKKTLQAMGMVRAFVDPLKPKGARFSGMTTMFDPMQQLYINQVLHKAFVEVNEKGTEAAAATAISMAATGMSAANHAICAHI